MTKCPYVPPHEFNLDFPHLMLRYRAAELRAARLPFIKRQLTETDRNGKMAAPVAPIANWASRCGNALTRPADGRGGGRRPRGGACRSIMARPSPRAPARQAGRQPRGARLRPQGGDLCHLLRQLQQPARSAMAALKVLARNGVETRGRLSRLLRHAAAGTRRPCPGRRARRAPSRRLAPVDRQGLRRRLAGAVLQPDAEVRVAADRARTTTTSRR